MITVNFETEGMLEKIQKIRESAARWKEELDNLLPDDLNSLHSMIAKSDPVRAMVKRTYDAIQNRNIPKFQRAFKEWQEKILIPAERKAINKVFGQLEKASNMEVELVIDGQRIKSKSIFTVKADPDSVARSVTARIVSSMKPEYIQEEGLKILKPGYTAALVDGANGAYRLAGIQAQFDVLKPEAVRMIDRIGADLVVEITNDQKLAIRSIVREGIIAGKSMPMIAKDLTGTCGLFTRWRFAAMRYEMALFAQGLPDKIVREKAKKYYNYLLRRRRLMIARTETGIAQAQGSLLGYKSIGTEEVRFFAAHGACEICLALDGNVYKIEEASGVIPVHPNGRCDWVAVSPKDGFKMPSAAPAPPSLGKGVSDAISDVMARYARRRVEHCSAVSKTGETFFRKSGARNSINFTGSDLDKMRGVTEVFIHNHPIPASFSWKDLEFAEAIDTGKMIIASEKFRYELSPMKGNIWAPNIARQLAYEQRILKSKYMRMAEKEVAAHKGPITREYIKELNDRLNVLHTQEAMENLVAVYAKTEKYKLSYKVTKVSKGG